MRVDNFRLVGVSETANGASVSKLHYHVFDAASKALVADGEESFTPGALPVLSLSLPPGDYLSSFATNVSDAELDMSGQTDADGYFLANRFSNHLAQVFGAVDTFSVNGDTEISLPLGRYYSQVRFEFTDAGDLSSVGRLVFTPGHDPFFYAPFATDMANPVLDQSDFAIEPDFANSGKSVVFHQFMGRLPTPKTLSYTVQVYGANNALLRTFSVSAAVRNNVHLVFRGELLAGVEADTGFGFTQDETWSGDQEESF